MKKMTNKLKKFYTKAHGLISTLLLIPFVYGCNEGGSAGGGFSDFSQIAGGGSFSGGGGGGGFGGGGGGGLGGGGETLVSPEPATLILMGSGMAAMAYFKTKEKNRKNKK